MNVYMTGIDFNKASLEYRERFALTKAGEAEMLSDIKAMPEVSGCVMISTCNRMELWISYCWTPSITPYEILCERFAVEPEQYARYFTQRDGDEAVNHLFELACGLKSMIFGEEQILSQVKDSISFARENAAADPILEALFRCAVTSAKKAKTKVRLIAVDRSVANTMIKLLREEVGELRGLNCLVIGSGEMGRLAARGLAAEGCDVHMTLRRYKYGDVLIPSGCRTVDFEERYEQYRKSEIIISATRSPHFTLTYEKAAPITEGRKILFDLAVPRDIEPKLSELPGIKLFDIDHLGGRLVDESDNSQVTEVKDIIKEGIDEFSRWQSVRGLMPRVNEITGFALSDLDERLKNSLKGVSLNEDGFGLVSQAANEAVSRVVGKFLLSLQKDMDSESFLNCIHEEDEEEPPEQYEMEGEELPLRFPLYVDLTGREVLVIGAGAIALRRIKSLMKFPCMIRVIAVSAMDEIMSLAAERKIKLEQKAYESSDIDGAYLVVAATDRRDVNRQVADDARRLGKHCSIADRREECTFYFPSIVEYPGGVIGICGTGEDHGRTKEIASEIREFMKVREEY